MKQHVFRQSFTIFQEELGWWNYAWEHERVIRWYM